MVHRELGDGRLEHRKVKQVHCPLFFVEGAFHYVVTEAHAHRQAVGKRMPYIRVNVFGVLLLQIEVPNNL